MTRLEHDSVSSILRRPRTCSRRMLRRVRDELTPYRAQTVLVQPDGGRTRHAAVFHLVDILESRVAATAARAPLRFDGTPCRVLIAVDATPVWQTSATRADVWLGLAGMPLNTCDPAAWSTWFVLDGGDNAAALVALDSAAHLNEQVECSE